MIFPAKLEPGDVIGLVAPSSPVDSDRIDECIVLLQNMGYRVKEGASCRKTYHGYLAEGMRNGPKIRVALNSVMRIAFSKLPECH